MIDGTCWLSAGSIKDDYAVIYADRKRYRLHRVVYENLVGAIPEGLSLDHLCRIKRCINPAHLEPVTHAENVRRGNAGVYNSLKTHCPKGHEYTEENTHIGRKNNSVLRGCRTCRNTARKVKRYENSILRKK